MDTEGHYVVTPAGCRILIDKCNTGLLNVASYGAEMGDEAKRLAIERRREEWRATLDGEVQRIEGMHELRLKAAATATSGAAAASAAAAAEEEPGQAPPKVGQKRTSADMDAEIRMCEVKLEVLREQTKHIRLNERSNIERFDRIWEMDAREKAIELSTKERIEAEAKAEGKRRDEERALELDGKRAKLEMETKRKQDDDAIALKRKQDDEAIALKRKLEEARQEATDSLNAELCRVLSTLSQHSRSADRLVRKEEARTQLDGLLRASLPEDRRRAAKIGRMLKVAMLTAAVGSRFVYVLTNEGFTEFYVGETHDVAKRIAQHREQGPSSAAWVKHHGLFTQMEPHTPAMEDAKAGEAKEVRHLMRKHGMDHVRGATIVQLRLTTAMRRDIIHQCVQLDGLCARCGHEGHMLARCKATTYAALVGGGPVTHASLLDKVEAMT